MQILSKRLPSLDSLIAFEAAARLGSFTLAAGELNVTQAAISQRIRNLESELGLKLFERAHRAVILNEAGREYQYTVSMALGHLAGATESLEKSRNSERLVVALDQAMAHLWMMPRLKVFCDMYPEIPVRLIVSDELEDCLSGDVDVALIFGGQSAIGFETADMFREVVFPVCAPSYLEVAGPLISAGDLLGAKLIELEDNRWDWMNWSIWINRALDKTAPGERTLQIGSYPLVIDAACFGGGVALGWKGLVDDLLDSGKLVKPMEEYVKTENGYNILGNRHSSSPVHRDLFISWVKGCLD
ncbi:MAG: LysR substrate-binding domain-containing protein [Rhizobiaceae bacterium]